MAWIEHLLITNIPMMGQIAIGSIWYVSLVLLEREPSIHQYILATFMAFNIGYL